MKMVRIFAALALAACALPAAAQSSFETDVPGDSRAAGVVPLQCDASRRNCRALSSTNGLPTNAQGTDGTTARTLRTDSRGGLVPAQGVASTTRTTLAASTATALEAAAVAGRIGLTVQLETALTANLFLCTTQATSCSATSYDAIIPNAAGAGTTYTFLFAPSTRVYAFSTGTPIVVLNSWVAP